MSKIAIILAGGKGTRLGEDMPPKAMLDINGKTLLERQLEWLKEEGFNKVILALGHRADEVIVPCYFPKMDVVSVTENEALGTAGAVKNCLLALEAFKATKVMVFNVDDVCHFSTKELFARPTPCIVAQPLAFSCHVKNKMFEQYQTSVHIGYFLLSIDQVRSLLNRGSLPAWFTRQKIVKVYKTRTPWYTVNTLEQLESMRKHVK